MKVAITDKWLPDLSPDERTHTVAVLTLHSRLDAVQHFLPLAAEKADEEVEHVHQLRVWTRRATAALSLYEEMIPHRRFGWLKKQLQRIRRAANNARDCDVLIQRVKQKRRGRGTRRWLEAAVAERAEAQLAVAAAHDRLRREDRFARRISKLLERVASRGEEHGQQTPRFGDWARERLGGEVERFFAAVPADPTDAASLHRFRIRGKQLRYVIELLAAAFPDRLRTELYPVIEAMQDRLGEINDLATAQARLRERIDRAKQPDEASDWRRLLAAERTQFEQAREKFWAWCTPRMLEELRAGFEDLLN
jgi:triphosphatase